MDMKKNDYQENTLPPNKRIKTQGDSSNLQEVQKTPYMPTRKNNYVSNVMNISPTSWDIICSVGSPEDSQSSLSDYSARSDDADYYKNTTKPSSSIDYAHEMDKESIASKGTPCTDTSHMSYGIFSPTPLNVECEKAIFTETLKAAIQDMQWENFPSQEDVDMENTLDPIGLGIIFTPVKG